MCKMIRLQVFDMTRLRGLSADSSRQFTEDLHYSGFGNAHNIAVNVETQTLYVIGATSASNPDWSPCAGQNRLYSLTFCSAQLEGGTNHPNSLITKLA